MGVQAIKKPKERQMNVVISDAAYLLSTYEPAPVGFATSALDGFISCLMNITKKELIG